MNIGHAGVPARALPQFVRNETFCSSSTKSRPASAALGHWCGWKPIAPEIIPDGVSWAKGIGGGFPIGAAWIRKRPITSGPDAIDLCDVLGPGSHGTTYGGSPLACAVSLAVLREIKDSPLCENSAALGGEIIDHRVVLAASRSSTPSAAWAC